MNQGSMGFYGGAERWLELAEEAVPPLVSVDCRPVRVVAVACSPSAFQGWTERAVGGVETVIGVPQDRNGGFVLDFGEHMVGYLRLKLALGDKSADAPLRLRLTFAEIPAELAEDFDPFHGGLSRGWLQDETITIDDLPGEIVMPRRYAFRYLKVEIVAASPNYRFSFDDIVVRRVSSAAPGYPLDGAAVIPKEWRRMDRVACHTLANCMQTVFEDGPKRDRRLWLGDLRLQALTNNTTFMKHGLVKRCLLLFSAFADGNGLVSADIYERPTARRGNCFILDYCALFPVVLHEYLMACGDLTTAAELWPVGRRQIDFVASLVDKRGLFGTPDGIPVFIDWNDSLHHQAAMQGVVIFALRRAADLAGEMGVIDDGVMAMRNLAARMTAAAREHFLNNETGLWESGAERQVSWASWAWMTLSGVNSGDEARESYRALLEYPAAVKPCSPYLYHYVIEALFAIDLETEAMALLKYYWGGMLDRGATTFWEVYDPEDERLSPYGNHLLNSYCHAWSCTPAYFIRRRFAYQEIHNGAWRHERGTGA